MSQTLFEYPQIVIDSAKIYMGIDVSLNFIHCINLQLTPIFKTETGIVIDKKYISLGLTFIKTRQFIELGAVSTWQFSLYVNHNGLDVLVSWQSISGKIYHPSDEVIDCADIQFWFVNLDPALVLQCMYPPGRVPFKLKKLSYELIVQHLDMDMRLRLYLQPTNQNQAAVVIKTIDDFINTSNEKSLQKSEYEGVVHNWKGVQIENGTIEYNLDMGSTGLSFFKKLLRHLSNMAVFTKVEVG